MKAGKLFFESGEEQVGISYPVGGSFVRRNDGGYDVLDGICSDGTRYRTVLDDGSRDSARLADAVFHAISLAAENVGAGGASPILVAGLGNVSVEADSLGPIAADRVTVGKRGGKTVFAVRTGVPEQTGIETADIVVTTARLVKAELIITVDSLCAVCPERLCSAVQVSDGGTVPGSGAGQISDVIDSISAGRPVISVGVPTVVLGRREDGADGELYTVCGIGGEIVFYSAVIAEAIGKFAR